jgi:hypothetical protein
MKAAEVASAPGNPAIRAKVAAAIADLQAETGIPAWRPPARGGRRIRHVCRQPCLAGLPVPGWVTGRGAYHAVMAGCVRARRSAVAAALGCAAMLGAGCAAGKPAPPPHQATSPTAAAGRPAAGLAKRAAAARYLAIAKAGNRRLEIDFDRLEGRDRNRLAAAEADLRDAAATERLFDRRLLRIAFPSQTERVARVLYRVNQARARLTTAAAASTSLRLRAAAGGRQQAGRAGGQDDPPPARPATSLDQLSG